MTSIATTLALVVLSLTSVAHAQSVDSDVVAGDSDGVLDELSKRSNNLKFNSAVDGAGISASFDAGVPNEVKVAVADVLEDFDSVFAFPPNAVQIGIGWRPLSSLGLGGPVLVTRNGGYLPAAVADTVFGGQHANGAVDGFVSMGSNQRWHFGAAAEVPPTRYDFRSAFAHELVHALGFTVETKVDGLGRTVLSGRTPQMDQNLYSSGVRLVDVGADRQSQAFSDDDVWFDIGGGRLIPMHSHGAGAKSHFGHALSQTDTEPGALMYAGLVSGVRHRLDGPVIGALARVGFPTELAPASPVDLTFDGTTLRWTTDLGQMAPPPETMTITTRRNGTVVATAQLPGAVEQYVVPPVGRSGVLEVAAASRSGHVHASTVDGGVPTMATATTVADLIRASDYRADYGNVLRLYWAFFNREPDVGGARYWIGVYQRGGSLDGIANAFAGSGEFSARYGSLSNAQYLSVIYRNVLGRERDNDGFVYWLGLLDSGRLTRGEVVRWIAAAEEFVSAHPFR